MIFCRPTAIMQKNYRTVLTAGTKRYRLFFYALIILLPKGCVDPF